jgi:hypothetical protein
MSGKTVNLVLDKIEIDYEIVTVGAMFDGRVCFRSDG